jgi:beta-mannosidase
MRVSECTAKDYDYLLGAAADANMNYIRVWGGGGVEKQAFYDAADREGLMVYQGE